MTNAQNTVETPANPGVEESPETVGLSQTDMAQHLLSITSDLTAVLEEENAALSMGQTGAIEALGQRKTDLFAVYARAMQSIQDLGTSKLDIKEALRQALRGATLDFKTSIERNQRLLKTQLDVSKGMMKAIGEEAERQQNPVKTYASRGNQGQPRRPTSLALNQTI